MKLEEIIALMEAVKNNDIGTFSYQEGDQKLVIKKKSDQYMISGHTDYVSNNTSENMISEKPKMSMNSVADHTEGMTTSKSDKVIYCSDKVITSPLVGTFYSSASPETDVYVKVGDTIKKGQVIGLIEAMKLMNEIESDFDGVIEAVLVDNEAVVEYGQPLFRIR